MNLANLFKEETKVLGLEPGQALFRQGDAGLDVYVLLEGAIEIVIGGSIVEVAERGAILGEMALVDRSARSASAIARSTSLVAQITPERFLYLVSQTPNFALQVMKIMSERLRHMDETLHPAQRLRRAVEPTDTRQ